MNDQERIRKIRQDLKASDYTLSMLKSQLDLQIRVDTEVRLRLARLICRFKIGEFIEHIRTGVKYEVTGYSIYPTEVIGTGLEVARINNKGKRLKTCYDIHDDGQFRKASK